MDKNITIHVANTSVMALYHMELKGQISDGKYENSRPSDHWKWVMDVKDIVVDETSGISPSRFSWSKKSYNIDEWIRYINGWRNGNSRYKNYGWATRIIGFAKFGRIYSDMTYETMKSLDGVRIILEEIQMLVEKGTTKPEEILSNIENSWLKSFYDTCEEYINVEFIKKYVNTKYDIKELKEDLQLLYKAVNERYNL